MLTVLASIGCRPGVEPPAHGQAQGASRGRGLAPQLALLLLPILVLLWATESRQQRARRWRQAGLTQQAIADRLSCSRSTVRRLLA